MASLQAQLLGVPLDTVPLLPGALVGHDTLQALAGQLRSDIQSLPCESLLPRSPFLGTRCWTDLGVLPILEQLLLCFLALSQANEVTISDHVHWQ